jgi:protein-tyrosine-phosphatase
MLVSQTPGGLHEQFFEDIGEEMKGQVHSTGVRGSTDMERIAKIAAEYGIEIPSLSRLHNGQGESTG